MISKMFIVLHIILLSFISSHALDIEKRCGSIERIVKKNISLVSLKNKIVFEESCMLWWSIGQEPSAEIEIYFHIWKSEQVSQERLKDSIDFLSEGRGMSKAPLSKFWDEAFLEPAKENKSGILLLRKGREHFKLVSKENEVLNRFGDIFMKLNFAEKDGSKKQE